MSSVIRLLMSTVGVSGLLTTLFSPTVADIVDRIAANHCEPVRVR
ncbi:hypothetical protein ABZ942_19395 [Nocardia sp. NPDC046473]